MRKEAEKVTETVNKSKQAEKVTETVNKSKEEDLISKVVKVTVNKMTQDRPSVTEVLFDKKQEFESIAINALHKNNLEKYLSQMALILIS